MNSNAASLFQSHERSFETNRYVYPVLSRRAGGLSIGVNLNLDKICNFDCVYCQVDRSQSVARQDVDLDRLRDELDWTVEQITSGAIYQSRFRQTPPELRRLNDIALSGDGEPTSFINFADICEVCADVRRRYQLDAMKLVLITNATLFHRERVRRGLETLDTNNGEIWAKLDAGSEDYYQRVARTVISFDRILDNLAWAARQRPIVIQTLFMRLQGELPPEAEITAYCDRLNSIVASGGQIKLVQVHTVARLPAESWVSPLENTEVDRLADQVRTRTGLPVAAFYAG